ncbi:MAG: glycosyltransferase family 2 protein [Kiritimatiellae bacterium]|nr:glycosyltransferase family 2 protein [Kiritimatiellia bacterium]
MKAVDIVIPVYNEKIPQVLETIEKIHTAFKDRDNVSVIVVDDGSDKDFNLDSLADEKGIIFLQHKTNKGYGSSLKTGITKGSAPWIAIIDADGTYPAESLPGLVNEMENADMVVGSRIGNVRQIPWLRRFPKSMLNLLASYMAGTKVKDLNSGMRVFSRELCYQLWPFFPRRFSFTSTITMGAHLGGFRVEEQPIDYFKRVGDSSIHPIKDTIKFAHIIIRMGTLFHPLKLFAPISIILGLCGIGKAIRDIIVVEHIGNLSVMMMLACLQIILMGYLGELIVNSRQWAPTSKK